MLTTFLDVFYNSWCFNSGEMHARVHWIYLMILLPVLMHASGLIEIPWSKMGGRILISTWFTCCATWLQSIAGKMKIEMVEGFSVWLPKLLQLLRVWWLMRGPSVAAASFQHVAMMKPTESQAGFPNFVSLRDWNSFGFEFGTSMLVPECAYVLGTFFINAVYSKELNNKEPLSSCHYTLTLMAVVFTRWYTPSPRPCARAIKYMKDVRPLCSYYARRAHSHLTRLLEDAWLLSQHSIEFGVCEVPNAAAEIQRLIDLSTKWGTQGYATQNSRCEYRSEETSLHFANSRPTNDWPPAAWCTAVFLYESESKLKSFRSNVCRFELLLGKVETMSKCSVFCLNKYS